MLWARELESRFGSRGIVIAREAESTQKIFVKYVYCTGTNIYLCGGNFIVKSFNI